FMSSALTLAITDLGSGISDQAMGTNNRGQQRTFVSTTILVKLSPQARANLKLMDEDVNPIATGVPALDAVDRDQGVRSFHAIVNAGAHRDRTAAINSWFKLTLPGKEERLNLIESTNDDASNLAYSGAEALGLFMARLKRESSIEAVALDYVMKPMF